MRPRVAAPTTAAFLAILACGCGQQAGPAYGPTVAVKGKVTYMGQPLSQGTIVFAPEDAGRDANGDIQPDGTFTLSTFKDGDGAVPGTHRIAVRGAADGGKLVVPNQFHNARSSKVEVEVTPDKTDYAIELK